MEVDAAGLSSLSTSLISLLERVTTMADGLGDSPREDVAADLYEIERSLRAADRRLRALLTKLR
jgi:hypothetical protein